MRSDQTRYNRYELKVKIIKIEMLLGEREEETVDGGSAKTGDETDGRMKEHERTVKNLDSEGKCLSPLEFNQL